jgi:ABC-type polysaccharide/polyol phosphate export permease
MFRPQVRKTAWSIAFGLLGLIFHTAVRNVRKSHGSPVVGLLMNMFQSVLMVTVFYLMLDLFGGRRAAVRGDFLLYIMSGVFLFMTHVKTLGAVASADGPTSPMMKHAPMNTIVAIAAAALASLYLQLLSAAVIVFIYHTLMTPITIDDPVGTLAMVLVAWASGIAIGMMLQSAKPWWPEGVAMVTAVYQRMNVIFSGKMFLANKMPGTLLPWFEWNPLFHTIDQTRGFVFLNYNPHYTSIVYPLYVAAVLAIIGLMGEFYSRKYVSASWLAGK